MLIESVLDMRLPYGDYAFEVCAGEYQRSLSIPVRREGADGVLMGFE